MPQTGVLSSFLGHGQIRDQISPNIAAGPGPALPVLPSYKLVSYLAPQKYDATQAQI